MILEIVSKLTSESLLSLYPIFVKKIGISSSLQLWTRLITYVLISVFFVNWSFIKTSLFSLDSITLGLVNLSHVFFSYEGFRNLDSGVSFAIFNSYPLMILLLAGTMWHKSYLLVILGLAFFIYGNYTEKKVAKEEKKEEEKKEEEKKEVVEMDTTLLYVEYSHPKMMVPVSVPFTNHMLQPYNELFTPTFVLRQLQTQTEYYFFDMDYTLIILDSNLNRMYLNSKQYILWQPNPDNYTIIQR